MQIVSDRNSFVHYPGLSTVILWTNICSALPVTGVDLTKFTPVDETTSEYFTTFKQTLKRQYYEILTHKFNNIPTQHEARYVSTLEK